jgi:hypothetical protein
MAELVALFTVLLVALLAIRAGGLALERTGLPRNVARFQAQSAFMHVGFTTSEAEHVVDHPVRRQVVQGLMWAGFGTSTAAIGTIAAALVRSGGMPAVERLFRLVGGGCVLVVLWRLRPLERAVDWSIERALRRVQWLEPSQVTELIEFGDHVVARISVGPTSWLAHRTLRQMRLHDEGVLVLTCTRADGTRLLSPGADTRIEVGDVLVCYGPEVVLDALGVRETGPRGAEEHLEASVVQEAAIALENAVDPARR